MLDFTQLLFPSLVAGRLVSAQKVSINKFEQTVSSSNEIWIGAGLL